jgi:hypothetical protein
VDTFVRGGLLYENFNWLFSFIGIDCVNQSSNAGNERRDKRKPGNPFYGREPGRKFPRLGTNND